MVSNKPKYMVRKLSSAANNGTERTAVVDDVWLRGEVGCEENGDAMVYTVGDDRIRAAIEVTHDGEGDWVSNPEGLTIETTLKHSDMEVEHDLKAVHMWDSDVPDMTLSEMCDEDGTREYGEVREEYEEDLEEMGTALRELEVVYDVHQAVLNDEITLREMEEQLTELALENGGNMALDSL